MNVDFHRSASVDPKAPLVAAESPFKKKILRPNRRGLRFLPGCLPTPE
jgi:hypothetical protein